MFPNTTVQVGFRFHRCGKAILMELKLHLKVDTSPSGGALWPRFERKSLACFLKNSSFNRSTSATGDDEARQKGGDQGKSRWEEKSGHWSVFSSDSSSWTLGRDGIGIRVWYLTIRKPSSLRAGALKCSWARTYRIPLVKPLNLSRFGAFEVLKFEHRYVFDEADATTTR